MSYLVGYTTDRSGADALALGRMLAAEDAAELTVCMVVPETWGYPSLARVDVEYQNFLQSYAAKALRKAKAAIGGSIRAHFITHPAASGAIGLSQIAQTTGAEFIVLGSAADGPVMHCSLGSVAAGVLSRTDLPVIIAPRAFKHKAAPALRRITCAYAADLEGEKVLGTATALCQRHGVPLRLVTFVVRDKQMYPTGAGFHAENMVANAWREQAQQAQQTALAALPAEVRATAEIGDGANWRKAVAAIDWLDGEILVASSHHMGTVSGFLFGTAFTRLLRYATVPIVAVP